MRFCTPCAAVEDDDVDREEEEEVLDAAELDADEELEIALDVVVCDVDKVDEELAEEVVVVDDAGLSVETYTAAAAAIIRITTIITTVTTREIPRLDEPIARICAASD